MFLPTNLTNRRQFLERSILGFGSTLFLPSLLASCTDHRIPDPDPATGVGMPNDESAIDWQDDIRTVFIKGIGAIPAAGGVVSGLISILWPSTNDDVWNKMKGNVEALVEQTLDTTVYNTAKANLDGLLGVINIYLNAIADKGDTKGAWGVVRGDFALYEPNFRIKNYQVLLLPLYTQFMNMYLSILRDGAIHGDQLGLTPGDQEQARKDIDDVLYGAFGACPYVDTWIVVGLVQQETLAKKKMSTGTDYNKVEPFQTLNTYNRQMTLTVLDSRNTWPFCSLNDYPDGKKGPDGNPIKTADLLTREIYSDPYGSTLVDYLGKKPITPIPLPSPLGGAPKSFPTQLSIWSGDRVDAIQVAYPPGSGPSGITQTPRMGGPGGNTGPNGEVLTYQLNNPITQFRVATNKATAYPNAAIIMLLQFGDSQNKPTKAYGSDNTPVDQSGWISFPNEAVSSVYVNGNFESNSWPSDANCVVVGFKFWDSPTADLRAVRLYYITSPREETRDDLGKAFPGVPIPDGLINAELKAARLAHWAWIKAHAK